MVFKSKDGKRNFGNRQQAQAYDSRDNRSDKPEPDAKNPEEARAPHTTAHEGDNEPSDMDIHEHVAQHGPAEKVEIAHHEGRHTKTSHHGGQKHVSHHDSPEEAHQHGMIAAGVQPQQEQQSMQPAMAGPSAIPGM